LERKEKMDQEKILVTYATMSGSTTEVAREVAREIGEGGTQLEILPLEKVGDLSAYNAVVIGAPMVMGWHRSALKFLVKNRAALRQIPLAVFATGMSLTSAGETDVSGVPVFVDEALAKPVKKPGRPGLKEHYTDINHYAAPIIKAAGPAHPVSVAFFGGRLDYRRLKLPAMLFVMLIVQAGPGDRRNWDAIRSWAASLPQLLNLRGAGNLPDRKRSIS
jgi:menaquinone-dependent protoporphyrinogen oxidase